LNLVVGSRLEPLMVKKLSRGKHSRAAAPVEAHQPGPQVERVPEAEGGGAEEGDSSPDSEPEGAQARAPPQEEDEAELEALFS
jgi:hypothetical protein